MFKDKLIRATGRDPLAALRQVTSEMDRFFDEFAWPAAWPALRLRPTEFVTWTPRIDVFEKDNRLFTKVELPGLKREEVKVEVAGGYLMISGERKRETEENKKNFYRSECEYGSFYRAVPLPEGVKPEDVTATFADGVLEVSVPLPATAKPAPRAIEIQEPVKAAKTAA
jgi:HSP20 family protein